MNLHFINEIFRVVYIYEIMGCILSKCFCKVYILLNLICLQFVTNKACYIFAENIYFDAT